MLNRKENKKQICIAISPELLSRIDQASKRLRRSRSNLITHQLEKLFQKKQIQEEESNGGEESEIAMKWG